MNQLEPTYLRFVYDGLKKGSLNSQNSSSLPNGFIGLFEQEFSADISMFDRRAILTKLGFWALFKGAVSSEMASLIFNESEDNTKALIDEYSKWFNSPSTGKYSLYHDRLRTYLLQKLGNHELKELNEKLISYLEKSLEDNKGDESEIYALEHLSTHMLVESQLNNNYKRFHDYVNKKVLWPRQISTSKEYKWSQNGVQQSIKEAARRHNEIDSIKSSVNSVNIYREEQNSIENILTFFYNSDFQIAIERLKRIEIDNRYKLSIFLLNEILSKSNNNIKERTELCSLIINSIKEINPTKINNYFWNKDFPVKLMYKNHLILKELGLDDKILWTATYKKSYGKLSFKSYIDELLDFKKNEETAKAFNNKVEELKNNQLFEKLNSLNEFNVTIEGNYEDGSKSKSAYKIYYLLAYLATYDEIIENEIDLFDILNLWKNQTEESNHKNNSNIDELFSILKFHFKRTYMLSKSDLENKKYRYSLTGDNIITEISKLLTGLKDNYKESKGTKEREFRIRFHKILVENSLKRSEKFNVNCDFFQDTENKQLLIKLCFQEDNIFKRFEMLSKICDSVKFNINEINEIQKKCEYELRNSNIHPAHLATANIYLAKILNKIGKINDSYNYFVIAFNDKKLLYDNNISSEDLKDKIGNLYTLIDNSLIIYSSTNLKQEKRDDILEKIQSLINIYIEIDYDRSNLLSFNNKNNLKDDSEADESWGFNLLLNDFLLNFLRIKEPHLSEILFNSFKKILKNLDLNFLLEINQNSIDYLESYLNTTLMSHSGYFEGFDIINYNPPLNESTFIEKKSAWAQVLFVNEISFEENLVSNTLVYYQNFIKLLVEKKIFDKAIFYFKEYSKNYFYENFRHKSLQLIFQQLYFNFIKNLLKESRFFNKNIIGLELEFYNLIIENIPDSKFNDLILDSDISHKLIKQFKGNSLEKKIFDAVNTQTKISSSFHQLNNAYHRLVKLKISLLENNTNNFSTVSVVEESILIIKERLYYLLKHFKTDNNIDCRELFKIFKHTAIELNKISVKEMFMFFSDNMVKMLYEIAKKNTKSLYEAEELIEFMYLIKREDEAKFFNSIIEKQNKISYSSLIKILTNGCSLYNPIEKKYQNDELTYLNDNDDAINVFNMYNNLTQEQRNYLDLVTPIPIIKTGDTIEFDCDGFMNWEKIFDIGCLLLEMEKFEEGISVLNKIPDSFKKTRSLAHFYSVKILLKKNRYKLAKNNHKKIVSAYFIVLSLFDFYSYYTLDKNEKKAEKTYELILKLAEEIKLTFEKADLYYELYKGMIELGKYQKASILKQNISELSYKLCADIFDCEVLFKNGEKRKVDYLIKKINTDLRNAKENSNDKIESDRTIIEYGSNLNKKYDKLKRLLNSEAQRPIIFYNEENIEIFSIDKIKTTPEFYLNFFKRCIFDYIDGPGCGLWRDELRRVSRLGEKEKIKCMSESIKFERFNTYDNGVFNSKLIQSDIFIQLGEYQKAFDCLPNYINELNYI